MFIAFILSPCVGHGQQNLLTVSGLVTQEGRKCKSATISLYKNNDLIKQVVTEKNGRFRLDLELSCNYTIEVEKLDYIAKRISISTNVPHEDATLPVYKCYLDIVPEFLFDGIDIGKLDFPIALVGWQDNYHEFYHNAEYTEEMMIIYEALLEEGFSRNGLAANN